ncbi:MAG: hypothetical protein EOM24_26545 [Chloroflexia bacterium]|nr:hypothetical protein [Chloroflexia bacterium]
MKAETSIFIEQASVLLVMNSDTNKTSDRKTSLRNDTIQAQRGFERIDELLDQELEQPNSAELPASIELTANVEETEATTDLETIDESPTLSKQPETILSEDGSHEQPVIAPESSHTAKRRGRMLEAGLIALPLIFNAVSSEAQIIEASQRPEQRQPEIGQMSVEQYCERQPVRAMGEPGEVNPDVELLAEAHDIEQRRRIEDSTAQVNEEPAAASADPPKPNSEEQA